MRIGVDARLVHYQHAGISRYILGLLGGMAEVDHGHEFVVLQHHQNHTPLPEGSWLHKARMWTPCHHRLEQVTLPMELSVRRLDVLHSPDFIPPFYRLCRSVITVHDLAFLRYPELLTPDSQQYYGQIGRAVQSADAIVAVSETTKQDLVDALKTPESKVFVIPEAASPTFGPVDDPAAVGAARCKFHLNDGYFLFVGTIEPRKNLATLVRSYAAFRERWLSSDGLKRQNPPKLAIVGQIGWLYDEVFQLVQSLDLRASVLFLREVSEADLVLLYNGAIALAFVSRYEGFGLPSLEAMACGTPVICSNVSALPEVVGDAAVLVSPDDLDAQAEALWNMAVDECYRETCRQRGLARVKQFSWKRTAQKTLDVYSAVGAL